MTEQPAVSFRDHMHWLNTLARQAADARRHAAFWKRSALGTWAVNLVLSAVIAYLLLTR